MSGTLNLEIINKKYLRLVLPIIGIGYIIYLLNHKKLLHLMIFVSLIGLAGLKETSINSSISFAFLVSLILFHYHDFFPQRVKVNRNVADNSELEEGMRVSSGRKKRVYYEKIDSPWFNRKQRYGPDAPKPQFGDFDDSESEEEPDEEFNYLEPFSSGCSKKKKKRTIHKKMLSKEKRKKLRERMKTVKEYRNRKKHLNEEEKKMYSKLPPKYYQNVNDIFKTKTRTLNDSFKKYDKLKENFYMIVNS